jgi:hypothetical protein
MKKKKERETTFDQLKIEKINNNLENIEINQIKIFIVNLNLGGNIPNSHDYYYYYKISVCSFKIIIIVGLLLC